MNNLNIEKIIELAAKDTEKGARVVAKFFYRVLRKKGFTESQIINISTNVLNCLIESLHGYENKVETVHESNHETIKKEPQLIQKKSSLRAQNNKTNHGYYQKDIYF